MPRRYYFIFDGSDVSAWRFCPKCGAEILEVYPGDYHGYITCFGSDDSCDIDFEVTYKEAGE